MNVFGIVFLTVSPLFEGYFVAILARLWPALAKSVVLINSAGEIIPGYSALPYPKVRNI